MRTDDIIMPKGSGISNYFTGLYMPSCRKADAMTVVELRRGLCAKSGGDWHVCERCDGGCSFGRRLTAIMRGVVEEPALPEKQKPMTVMPPVPQGKPVDKRMRFAPEKWEEVIKDIQARVQAGSSFKAACQAHGTQVGTVRHHMRANGYTVPRNPKIAHAWEAARRASAEVRTKNAIQKAARALLALEQGMSKAAAAKAGGYSQWWYVSVIQDKYRQEVETEKRRLRDEPPATP